VGSYDLTRREGYLISEGEVMGIGKTGEGRLFSAAVGVNGVSLGCTYVPSFSGSSKYSCLSMKGSGWGLTNP